MLTPSVREIGRLSAHQGIAVPTSALPGRRDHMSPPAPAHGESSTSPPYSGRPAVQDRAGVIWQWREVAAAA
jgi:hypothetical protein